MLLGGVLLLQHSEADITIASTSPSTAIAGDVAFWLTVHGSGFDRDSVVRLDGADRTTTFMSPTTVAGSIMATESPDDCNNTEIRDIRLHAA